MLSTILVEIPHTITFSHTLPFIVGSGRYKAVGELPAHGHTATSSATDKHSHTLTAYANASGGGGKGYWFDRSGSLDTTQSGGDHNHIVTISNTGGSQSHNNMQPYLSCYMWKRTT
ncbi:phage baseplate protein [Phascolarctobacterium faecium]|uniref:phage baseplate protein n=1 Tax=Phascolarctobacterium faecium TaxID=33025 RepID=UPI003AB3C27B